MFSYGNNIYGLLTGLWIFYEDEDDQVVQQKVTNQEIAYIDPRYETRSYAEGVLVKVLKDCWIHDPDERVDIFHVVKQLRDAVKENDRLMKEEQQVEHKS